MNDMVYVERHNTDLLLTLVNERRNSVPLLASCDDNPRLRQAERDDDHVLRLAERDDERHVLRQAERQAKLLFCVALLVRLQVICPVELHGAVIALTLQSHLFHNGE